MEKRTIDRIIAIFEECDLLMDKPMTAYLTLKTRITQVIVDEEREEYESMENIYKSL